jgi:nitrogen fixation/metabolism regulation signal transduction histidine kinase
MKRFIERINTQMDVLERLVDQFRSFSREPEVNMKTVAVHEKLRSIAGDMSSRIETRIKGEGHIQADPYLLNQVFLNIWKNALEAGANVMTVTIENLENQVVVRAKDNGEGIDSKELDRIWLPYVSMKKGGTGLGLPVIKRLVETMGGRVGLTSVHNASQHGLCVEISFKRANEKDIP